MGMVRRMNTCGLRLLLAILLAVLTGVGSTIAGAAHAAAMGFAAGATEVVICVSGGGTETILVDSAGDPVEPQKQRSAAPCDDCLPSQANAIAVSAFALAVGFRTDCRASRSPLRPAEKNRSGSNSARAPPTGEIVA